MKKAISMTSLILVITLVLNAQVPEFTWTKTAGGTNYEYGRSVATDPNGNVIVGGEYYHDLTLGGTTLSGWSNPFIAKMDAAGNYLWAVDAGGGMNDLLGGVCTDAAGNIYATGMFQGPAAFGSETLTGFGNADIFITKLDTDGNFLWAKEAGSITGSDHGYSIVSDASGNIYVTGYFSGTATFGSFTLNSSQQTMFVAKLDQDGNFLWASHAISSQFIYGKSIAVDMNCNSYVTGYFTQTASFGSDTYTSAGDYDIYITKLDASGNFVWAKAAGNQARDWGYSISADNAGNIYTTGYFERTVSFGSHTLSSVSLYKSDIYITKMDDSGNFIWAKQAGGDSYDKGFSITTDQYGNIYTSGQFLSTATFGPHSVTGPSTSVSIYITRLDPDGNFLWVKQAGSGPGNDMGESIATDNTGNIYVAGTFEGNCTFGSNTYTSAGYQDFFITKLAVPIITTNWTGAINTDWDNAANWDNGIPGTASNTFIPDVSSASGNYPEINASSVCKELTINTGAALTVNPSGNLTVTGLSTNNGNFTMKSNAGGTASFIDNGVANNGNFIIERYSAIADWHLIGTPVSNALAGTFQGMYLQSYDETTAIWTDITDETEILNVMQGYGLWTTNPGDIYTFNGSPNSGSISASLTAINTNGWNLLSNPYPSGIDWDLINKPAEINGAIYYLDAATENYVSYNGGMGGGSRYIPPMQGFWVSTNSSGNLEFKNSHRTHLGTDNYYKSEESLTDYIVLKASGNNLNDKTYIQFKDEATAAFDGQYDAFKLLSLNPEIPQVFSIAGEDNLSINRIPEMNSITIGFSSLESGEFTISIDETSGFENIVLEDKVVNALTNLFENDYTFQYQVFENPDRFILHFTPLAINEKENINDVVVYAFNSTIYLKSAKQITSGKIEIFDITGTRLFSRQLSNTQFEGIQLNQTTGNYIVKIIANNEVYVNKVFIK